ncbi:LPS-assembly protein LptD [Candidatus Venteria ishoeyi]|uniref:LPS-assembly protein LptD n=1 Tax=Candidatus Venteria ishoeyi TaxID=1899563 RepID=A0A1H6FG03_9GAMM|nr:LPS assembly protein LptD [Candidatus Venteria ishoeyi]MDM8547877.1 LPS assembly protein LptD [Candidatus Venteria ishoeyi]SEH08967.1 LPS-assembly protein LptD precursor [Candidatus Venteria ishoeyi]
MTARLSLALAYSAILLLPAAVAVAEDGTENTGKGNAPVCRAIDSYIPKRPDLKEAMPYSGFLYLNANQADIVPLPITALEKKPSHNKSIMQLKNGSNVAHEYIFSGDVLLEREGTLLRADRVSYRDQEDSAIASGDVTIWGENFVSRSDRMELQGNETGTGYQIEYWLPQRQGHGSASMMQRQQKSQLHLENMRYTTCQPKNEFWSLSSSTADLDFDKNQGRASNVVFRIKDVPVLYVPWLRFPISDDRQSGLLIPDIGNSNSRGLEFSLPYYWNIAPNYDATIAPRFMSKRGLMLEGEFRYLTQKSAGKLQAAILPSDRKEDAQSKRYQIQLNHLSRFTARSYADIHYNEVSDNHYLEDFGNTLELSSITHLEQRADLGYMGTWYSVLGRVQSFQTLLSEPASRPYKRLPQVLFATQLPALNRKLHPSLNAEYVYFDRNTDIITGAIGHRIDSTAAIDYPIRKSWGYVIPKIGLRYTHYDLKQVPNHDGGLYQDSRLLYDVSMDSGLYLERPLSWFSKNMIQTLEPRLFYLYRPYKDQSALPVFDSAAYEFSFGQLFRDNRFAGTDRVSDENRLSFALSSRLLSPETGKEWMHLSIGQMIYFANRRVTLPGVATQTRNSSNLLTQFSWSINDNWQTIHDLDWDPDAQRTQKYYGHLRYHKGKKVVNLGYRLNNEISNALEQTDVSVFWPINRQWNAVGRWNYSLKGRTTLEAFAGLEYHSCCWALRVVGRRYLKNTENEYTSSVFLQLELKGLAGLGKSASAFLQRSIPGFEDTEFASH